MHALYDLRRRSESVKSLQNVRFALRTRSDLDPKKELGDDLQWMNEYFIDSLVGRGEETGVNLLDYSILNDGNVVGFQGTELDEGYTITKGEHTPYPHRERCTSHKIIRCPPREAFDMDVTIWNKLVSSKWDAINQLMVHDEHTVAVSMFRGTLCDISLSLLEDYPLRIAKLRLMHFILDADWTSFRERYRGKYPLGRQEYEAVVGGQLEYSWPFSDIYPDAKRDL